jgi:hypothetical protein
LGLVLYIKIGLASVDKHVPSMGLRGKVYLQVIDSWCWILAALQMQWFLASLLLVSSTQSTVVVLLYLGA